MKTMGMVAPYILLTDSPPLRQGGHGCCVLSTNWINAVGNDLKLVVTRRQLPSICLENVCQELSAPVFFYPDLARVRWPRRAAFLKSLLEILLLVCSLGRISRAVKANGGKRLFAFFGGNPWFLLVTYFVAWKIRLPLDIYLVDDLEESARLEGQRWLARLVRWFEPRVLRRAERVFVISPGYSDHLSQKYGVASQWLPIPFAGETITHHAYSPASPDVRAIAYLGAVNHLYLSSIKELLEEIEVWNRNENTFKLKLVLMTYSHPDYVKKQLGDFSNLELLFRQSDEECLERMRQAWVLFLPYSFEEGAKVMVSTSFPSRLARCMVAGRPLLVYGPAYGSLPRYFKENHLAMCVESRSELKAAFAQIDELDSPVLIEQYRQTLERLHSRRAIRERLEVKT